MKTFRITIFLLLTGMALCGDSIVVQAQDSDQNSPAKEPAIPVLAYRSTSQPLQYLVTSFSKTIELVQISQESGETPNATKTSYEYIEAQKELSRKSQNNNNSSFDSTINPQAIQASNLNENVKTLFLKRVNSENEAVPLRPVSANRQFTANGRLTQTFDMANLFYFGLPLYFPREKLTENSTWEKETDIRDGEVPPLSLKQVYKVTRLMSINLHPIIEFEYTLHASLESTKITTDPALQESIALLKNNHIDKVSYEGQGQVRFDYEQGTVVTHTLNMTRRIQKSVIQEKKRIVQDLNTTCEYAEALTN